MKPAFDPATGDIMMDFGFGPVPTDAAIRQALVAFSHCASDAALRMDPPAVMASRAHRKLSFAIGDAELDAQIAGRAHQREACPILTLIPRVEPLRCQIVPLNPSRWPAGTSFGPDAA